MPRLPLLLPAALLGTLLPLGAQAQPGNDRWQACASIAASADRLACFDRWAESQRAASTPAPAAAAPADAPSPPAPPVAPPVVAAAPVPPPVVTGPWRNLRLTQKEGCYDLNYSAMSRYWELEPGADCGAFGIRGYRPLSLGVVTADNINRRPTSDNPANNAPASQHYRHTETRLQLSVRTKVAQGLLTGLSPEGSDSLWLGYTQQSYWQVFSPGLSRPFRSTDHEPELIYVLPLQSAKEGSWRLRFGGLGLVHQSNGQSLPYSRSWNRLYLMAGAESGPFQLQARVWRRLAEDAADDDNPGITNYIGRGELRGSWQANADNLFAATLRHSLRKNGRGSLRLEWFRSLGPEGTGGLQFHTQLFSGYGDSLLDYNRRRTVLSLGFSLVEW